MFLRTTILALLLVLVGTACSEDQTSPAASAPAAPAPAEPAAPDSATAPAPSGTLALPDDLPGWPGAEVVASGGDPAEGMIVSLRVKRATPDEVFTHYREGLAAKGWKLEGEVKSEDGSMLVAAKGSRRATLMIAPDDEAVEVSVTMTNATE